jgi:hypothetical protein
MNNQYHRKTLIGTDADHPLIQTAVTMLDTVEQAITNVANGTITITEYIDQITPYDQFMWEEWHRLPQKSNPINIGQNKKYSTWREMKWAPIFELIRKAIQPIWKDVNLVVIQNRPVVETVYSNGYIAYKDVDGGLGIETTINNQSVLVPVIAVEDKGGHACSTCFNGVNAQGLRLHQSFPNSKHVFITDNNISVGKDKGTEIADNINIVISERGTNKKKEVYPALKAERFQEIKDGIISKLTKMSSKDFTDYTVISSTSTSTLRASVEQTGIVWNW